MAGGSMPNIETRDGHKRGAARALVRMLAQKHGYYPDDPIRAYENDMLVDGYYDIFNELWGIPIKPAAEQPELMAKCFNESLPKFLKIIDPYCARGQFLVGSSLAPCDFWIGNLYVSGLGNAGFFAGADKCQALLKQFPNFHKYGERFKAANKKYLDARAPSPM